MSHPGKERQDEAIEAHIPIKKRRDKAKETFVYKWGGIFERHGYSPFWLMIVWGSLLVWAVYYLIAYWSPPPSEATQPARSITSTSSQGAPPRER